ncbi:MAG: hypothetical protein ACM3NO_10160, partial [Deltaproteobacteria bacterium]
QELELQVLLGSLLIARGFSARERGLALKRAYELCREVGEQAQLASILFHLCQYNIGLSRLDTARDLAQRALALAPVRDLYVPPDAPARDCRPRQYSSAIG